jgi:hypothetical protein
MFKLLINYFWYNKKIIVWKGLLIFNNFVLGLAPEEQGQGADYLPRSK